MTVNVAALTDGEVREALVQMAQSITTQAHAITSQATREGAPRENPHASTTASRLRDFTTMNPPVYYGSRLMRIHKSLWMSFTRFFVLWVLVKRKRLSWMYTKSKM